MLTAASKSLPRAKVVMVLTLAIALTCGTLWLAGDALAPPDASPPDEQPMPSGVAKGPETAADDSKVAEQKAPESERKRRPLSAGQRVARLERTIEADRQQLATLRDETQSPGQEFRVAEDEFKQIDQRWRERRRQFYELRRSGKTQEADALMAESAELESQWQIAKERFDLALIERKTLREKATALERKIQHDSEALRELLGVDPAPAVEASPPAVREGEAAPAAEPQPRAELLGIPSFPPLARGAVDSSATPSASDAQSHPSRVQESNHALARAKKDADLRLAAARDAEHRAESVNQRIEGLRGNVQIEQQLLDIARTKADQAQTARANLDKELQRTLAENPAELDAVWQKIAAADERYTQARNEVRDIEKRLEDLRRQLGRLQDDQISALGKAKQTHDEAQAAQGLLNRLQNPFTPTNILQWFFDHGPKLLTILAGTLMLSLVVKLVGRQIAQIVARGGSRGTARDRENRAVTLVGVFRNTASLVLITGGLLMALDEVGIPIGPLMGGAAVLGLAVAFGAQNLIRDYFSGFMVLLEDQYGIGDVVTIGEASGSVEKITLRMTVLRDLEGALHFIPHGSITRVTNLTHGWSRAVVDIGVAYKEDPDRVMNVLLDIGKEMRRDPAYGPLILDGPEMLGLENLGDSSVVFRFFLKTQPLQRWFVRRELLRRIKRTFDEVGIEIPFPQRTIHHRYDDTRAHAAAAGRPHDANGGQ
jgi:small conductance mechanosensitive channel